MDTDFLDWALAAFSGYVAADELYEGPYCVLSAVDNRQYTRILYAVLDHDPTHDDITTFLGRLKSALVDRGLALQGITTDGSPLSPEPIRTVFGEVAHQICTFHVLKELTQGILSAVAAERNRLTKSKPKLQRGRPASKDKVARRLARQSQQIQEKIRGLFQDRFLFVKRRLKPSERKRLVHITRGLPQLRTLREIMGGGDIKLIAMLGAFLGWHAVLVTIFLAAVLGACVGLTLILLRRQGRREPLPFGPFLALGALLAMGWGETIFTWYVSHSL